MPSQPADSRDPAAAAAAAATGDDGELRKQRGAFFTPPELSEFLVEWAIRGPRDRVLEPSCGEASFLLPAAERLAALGGAPLQSRQLTGIELDRRSAARAARKLARAGFRADIEAADFFDVDRRAQFDAVIGNPPYIRYQSFAGEPRAKALAAAAAQGVRLTRLASSWAAFVLHAAGALNPAGRLALVLPAELLAVSYAAPVRRFLMQRFARLRLVAFEERVFPGVMEEVVLLLAEGAGPAKRLEVRQARNLADLARAARGSWRSFTPEPEGKWTPALAPAGSFASYQEIVRDCGAAGEAHERGFDVPASWGSTYLGAVTGSNRYFTLTAAEARAHRIPPSSLLPISPPGSRHLRGLSFCDADWDAAKASGASCYLFYPARERLGAAERRYTAQGEAEGIHRAYKCTVRYPWWRVPLVPLADLLLTYMDRDRPRLVTNLAGALHLNSLYGVGLKREHRRLGRDLLPLAALNSVTLLGAEIVGRSYGGGLLKLEPTEADRLPLPTPATVGAVAGRLRALRREVAKCLRSGRLLDAADAVDQVLLREHLEVPRGKLQELREARAALFARRVARGKRRDDAFGSSSAQSPRAARGVVEHPLGRPYTAAFATRPRRPAGAVSKP